MSDDIGVGDWVRCVDDSPDGWGRPSGLIEGEVYRVLEVWPGLTHVGPWGDGTPGAGVTLEGVPDPIIPDTGERMCFGIHRFTPLGGDRTQVARREMADA